MRLLLLLTIALFSPLFVFAQDKPLLCSSQNTHEKIFVRYDWQNAHLSVISWGSGETQQELESSFPVSAFSVIGWSPSCQYVLAEVHTQEATAIFAWNVITGQRVGSLNGSATRYTANWSTDEQFAVLQVYEGGFLWNIQTNEQTLINAVTDKYGRSFYTIEWDQNWNELLVVKIGSGNGVTTYNLTNYQQTAFYHIGNRRGIVTYRELENPRYLLVYTSGRERIFGNLAQGLALWDRDTQANIQFDPNVDNFVLSSFGAFDVLGDLSSRSFIISDYGLYAGQLYVWDLQNLTGNTPYIPNYQQHLLRGGDIRLVDENALEVVDWLLPRSIYKLRSTLIDLNTYTQVSVSPLVRFRTTCDTPPPMLEWACQRASVSSVQSDLGASRNHATYYPPKFR